MSIATPLDDLRLLPLTPAERLKAMGEALDRHIAACQRTARLEAVFVLDGETPDYAAELLLDEACEDEIDAEEEVIAHLKVLTADGILDRCIALLAEHGAD